MKQCVKLILFLKFEILFSGSCDFFFKIYNIEDMVIYKVGIGFLSEKFLKQIILLCNKKLITK